MTLPTDFIGQIRTLLVDGTEAAAFLDALQSDSSVSIRLNRRKVPDMPLPGDPVPWCVSGCYLAERPSFTFDPLLHAGGYYVQEASSMFVAWVLRHCVGDAPVQMLDLCAAPGGKSLLLAERMESGATLTAADRSARRQKLTQENFRCRGLEFPVVVAEPRELTGSFDLVLADVPCSNTGVFRRRPDALWRFRESGLREITALQNEILEAAALRVAPGGQLVYSTCSIEPEENAGQIERFLSAHPEFEAAGGEQLLPSTEHDGAYAFLLRRNSKSMRR